MKAKDLIKILQKIPEADLWIVGGDYGYTLNPENLDYDKARNIFWFDAVGFNSPEPEILELLGNDIVATKGENDEDL
jgi:hypothetical protein